MPKPIKTTHMKKIFHCIWTHKDSQAVNSYDEDEREEPAAFFSEDNGYTKEDIEEINKLSVGKTYNCEYGNHSVRRIQ